MASESKSRRQAPKAPVTRASARRSHGGLFGDAESSARVLLVGSTIIIVAIAVAFIAFGYYWSVIRPRGRTVLEVNDVEISYRAMKRRMEFEYFTKITYQNSPGILPTAAKDALVKELLLVTGAEALGVVPTDAEIDDKLRSRVGATPDADERTFADRYKNALDVSGLTDAEYRRLSLSELLETKIREKFQAEIPAAVPQARIEVIATSDEGTARTAADRVRAGEPWATVAAELSLLPDAATTGGAAGPSPSGFFDAVYNDYVFSAPVGEVSPPLESQGAAAQAGAAPRFYIVRVVERSDLPLADNLKTRYANQQYDKWLEEQETQAAIVDNWSTDTTAQVNAVRDIIEDAPPQQQQPQPQLVTPIVQTTVAAGSPAPEGTAAAPPAQPTAAAPAP